MKHSTDDSTQHHLAGIKSAMWKFVGSYALYIGRAVGRNLKFKQTISGDF